MSEKKKTALIKWWNGVPRAVKAAFVCCFIAGFIVHIFAFTNIIPNSDGVSRVYDEQQMTVSGRWFLHYASVWNGYFQAPAVIGFFSLLFMSLSASAVAALFKIKSAFIGGACGVLMIVFPSVAYTYLYTFTASAYFFGLLLAAAAVLLVTKYKFGFLFAAVPLACAIGTYQAYLAAAVSLSLIFVILYAMENGRTAKDVALCALKFIVFLALGTLLYFGMLKLYLAAKELTLLNYKGIGTLGEGLTLRGIAVLVYKTYKRFVSYFFLPRGFSSYTTVFSAVVNAGFAAVGLWAFVKLTVKNKRPKSNPGAFALTLVLCALLPLALNLTVMMGEAMPIMRYALVFTYVFALVLADRASSLGEEDRDKDKKPRCFTLRGAAILASVFVFIISFNVDNIVYTVSAQAHRSSESFATRLVERVESAPGYKNGMEVVIIGGFPSGIYNNDIEPFSLVEDYSALSTSVMPLNKHIYYYLNDWMNVTWREPDEDLMIAVSDSPGFQDMPLWPDDGCVKIQDGRVIVKLAEEYTPKKDYEKQYENRK